MITARVTIEVKSPNGRRKFKRTYKGHSFVRNFLRLVGGVLMAQNPVSAWALLDSLGNSHDAGTAADDQANLLNSEIMILVGSGATPPDTHDYQIEAMLGYAECNLSTEFDSDPVYEIFWQVSIQNTSGGLWVVSETALYCRLTWENITRQIMIARDAIDPVVNVPNGDFVNVTYGLRSEV